MTTLPGLDAPDYPVALTAREREVLKDLPDLPDILQGDDPRNYRKQDHRHDHHLNQIEKNSPERLDVIVRDIGISLEHDPDGDPEPQRDENLISERNPRKYIFRFLFI